MKKIFLVAVLLFSVILTGIVLAREPQEPVSLAPEIILPELPNPGLIPGDFFYFLDMWGEAIGELFTFRAEARAILQTERTLERIAEVNALLEREGVDAPGLTVAEAKIQRNIVRANDILERQKARGIEVAQLAKRLESDFDVRRKTLNQVFDSRRDVLAKQVDGIRTELRRVRAEENLNRVSELRSALDGVRTQKERLSEKRDAFQDSIVSENEKIKQKMRERDRELRRLEQEKEALADEGERVVEILFEEREIAIEAQEEILEIQLNQAILAEDTVLIEQIHNQLTEVEFQAEVLEIEETQLEEKIEAEVDELETAIEIILETRDDQDNLKIMADKARMRAKKAIEKALVKAEEQNIEQNPTIIGLIKQAERFHERGLMLFEKGEYKKSYLSSRKAIDFTEKAFKLITVKENLRREKPDLPVVPVVPDIHILPVEPIMPIPDTGEIFNDEDPDFPAIIDPQEISLEKIKWQLKRTEQIIEKTRRIIRHEDVEAIVFPVVVKLIERAENNIDKAEALLEEGMLNSARRQAIEARGIAGKAYKIIQRKLQTGEIKITPEPTERTIVPLPTDKPIHCQTDADCKDMICPMVIGYDTPQCGPDGFCFCGPGEDFERRRELEG